MDVVSEDFYELKHFCIEALVVNFEMSRTYLKPAFNINLHTKELLKYMESKFEIGVFHIESQFDKQVVVFVVGEAKAVAFKKLSVADATVAKVDLTTFGVSV